ncbi:MAG TPA: type II toxin-antitoxin system VapC family toxin [Tepidisphaeraceae bacterium]|nr:type II toxin-antitoxin system VapC family toxin [Tepidisphaeraceae bacterium]
MIYLLDTNAWISYLNAPTFPVAQRLARTSPASVRLCSVVKSELYYGAYRSARVPANLALLTRLATQFASVPFDDAAADHCGRFRAHLAALGTPIGPNDVMIASIAVANGFTLVTHNVREFSRIPGLAIEDWQTAPTP